MPESIESFITGGNRMKKLLSMLLVCTLVFSFGIGKKTQAASPTDWWTDQDAKVSPYVYSLLLDRAGFAAYIFTDTKVSMNPQNLSNFTVEEKFENFFIGYFDKNLNKVLVTKDGLIVSYTQKNVSHSIIKDDKHLLDVQSAVKIFVGPTITDANYINFSSLESNKALSIINTVDRNQIKLSIPSESKINDIGLSRISFQTTYGGKSIIGSQYETIYGTIVPDSLQPGNTHELSIYNGTKIDGVPVYNEGMSTMNIFYTSNVPIDIQGTKSYAKFDLKNKFVPVITDVAKSHGAQGDIGWAVLQGLVRGYENGSFKPENTLTESQFVSILSKYYNIETSLDGKSTDYNVDGAYIYLKKHNFPLKGYQNKTERNKPVSRGVVAQTLSMTQGGPSNLQGAYEFLAKNNLTVATSLKAYDPSGSLKRSHISSFFKRMDGAGLTELRN